MGEPVKILDLARDLITLSGLKPGDDIEIQFTGIRPGEKLFEELSVAEETVDKTRHPKIFVGRNRPHVLDQVRSAIDSLRDAAQSEDPQRLREKLRELVPEYSPQLPAAASEIGRAHV